MDAYFNFNLDENFKEVIKSRYRDEFQYESFSGGQRFRIDMALLLTWREISRKKNSTNCNLLILDEVFDGSLDLDGVQEFMKLLRILSKKIHIFAISHKADMISDRFDRHLKVDIKNNFSTIKE
jgi:DNA repair exonuclease SbcCD ATPase subunit